MSETFRQTRRIALTLRSARLSRAQSGQTLVVALAVLFILLFIGGVFVVRVARNLTDSARGRDTEDARALAEAGLKYCDNELNGSPDGADWRPVPSAPIGPNNGANDPDYFWLQRGFTRLNLKGGRALVRVSYDPDPDNPVGQAIKIESIGRSGELDPQDPTVFVQNQTSPRLRREMIAYKRIGITDYLRFFTDKDRGNHENFIGVPAVGHFFPQVYGNPMLAMNAYSNGVSGTETLYGGPIYCNSNLSIIGDTYFYEGPRGADPSKQQEAVQVAGNITTNQFTDTNLPAAGTYASSTATRFNMTQPVTQAYVNTLLDLTGTKRPVTPTLDKNAATTTFGPNLAFNTYNGAVRDGSAASAANGATRDVTRLNPPSIDTNLTNTGSLRVRQITEFSGFWQTQTFNTGMHGWGTNIYVDNTSDLQQETLTPGINGSFSLPTDWTNPNAGFAQSAWNGPYYRPPGVLIELLGDRMRLTRSDGKPFYKSDGTTATTQGNGGTIEIPFSDLERSQLPTAAGQPVIPPFAHDGDEPYTGGGNDPRNANDPVAGMAIDPHSYGVNIVLFAEGNIRVKGVYGTLTDTTASPSGGAAGFLSRVHLTLITGGTAYVEGNLLKGDGKIAGSGAPPVLQRNSTCSILAKDYVCVNTSMFMQPQNQTNVWSRITPDIDAFATEIGLPRATYDTTFSNGVSPTTYAVAGNPMSQMLLLRHTSVSPGPTAINMLINPVQDNGSGNTQYQWPFYGGTSTTYPLGERNVLAANDVRTGIVAPDPAAITSRFEGKAFPINNSAATNAAQSYITYPGFDNTLRFQVDQSLQVAQTGISLGPLQSYLLSAIMVAPLDIRIEAAMYAQEKSFFIIPGYAFNGDPNDTRAHAIATGGTRASFSAFDTLAAGGDRDAKRLFPYTSEPLDVRITICGAIAESYSANVGAQAAWLRNWGYLPATYGSSTTQVPDDHLFARTPRPSANLPLGYVAGDTSSTADYRTPLESTVTNGNDFLLTRALQFEYDPALAMPYFHSTDTNLTGQNLAKRKTRMGRALRFLKRTITNWDGTNNYEFRQTLPPMPRLPLGPDLIYSGNSDVQLGEQDFDTDQFKP